MCIYEYASDLTTSVCLGPILYMGGVGYLFWLLKLVETKI